MENNFDQKKFIEKLRVKFKNKIPNCQFCGGNDFTVPTEISSVVLSKKINTMQLGLSMPAGMIVCTKCGHMSFFALGALGMLSKEEGGDDGKN